MTRGKRKNDPITISTTPVPLFSLLERKINPRIINNACQVNRKSRIRQGTISARSAIKNKPKNINTMPSSRCALPDFL